jgi:glycosyltransferase involved in cell wall biosynthesis
MLTSLILSNSKLKPRITRIELLSMNIGYHYHVPFKLINNKIYLPSYFGLFIDELAKNSTTLYLFLFEQTKLDSEIEDYALTSRNIELINLGNFPTFYHRLLYPFRFLKVCRNMAPVLDHFIVRSPTPLSAYMYWTMRKYCKVTLMIVGDYVKSLGGLEQPIYRKIPIIFLTYYYQFLHISSVKKANVVVNSYEMLTYLKKYNLNIKLIKTTTLSEDSFFNRLDTCNSDCLRLLYTGRINFAKGLMELVEAVAELQQKNKTKIELHIVGWEDKSIISISGLLKKRASELGITDCLFFHGKKKIGEELNSFYKMADIYVIPSYHEGFPRTIWEALSQSTPVIATTVGGIPYFLTHKKNALLIAPKSIQEIVDAITLLTEDKSLRQELIKNGYELAKEVTLEHQTKLLINGLEN